MEGVGLSGGVLSLFTFWFKAAFKALFGVLGSCLLSLHGVW